MWVLTGKIVTFDDGDRVLEGGSLFIGDDGRIAGVTAAGETPPAGFDGARRVRVGGFVYPGLIDLHNHLPYNTIGLWREPTRRVPFVDHNEWTEKAHAPSYRPDVSAPGQFLGWVSGVSLMAYVEMKALLGGTTTVQGNGKVNFAGSGSLARNIDSERFGTDRPDYLVTTLVKTDPLELAGQATAMVDHGAGFIYHVAEGVDPELREDEFDVAVDGGVVRRRLIAIHGVALNPGRLQQLKRAGAALVWSPFSNMWLYGATADIGTATRQKLRVCLGSDWSPSGTKHVLGELKVADLWNRNPAEWAPPGAPPPPPTPVFSDLELCRLVTANPGDAIAEVFGPQIGRLQDGCLADLIVVARRDDDSYRNLIEATERDVQLVVVGGEPRLGTPEAMKAAGGRPNTVFTAGPGLRRAALLRSPADPTKLLSWRSVTGRLAEVRADPDAAQRELALALAAVAGDLSDTSAPFVVIGDMPLGEGFGPRVAGRNDPPEPCPIPPLDSLTHDAAFFDSIDSHTFHRGLLSPLRVYYDV